MKRKKLIQYLESFEGVRYTILETPYCITATMISVSEFSFVDLVRNKPDYLRMRISAKGCKMEVVINK